MKKLGSAALAAFLFVLGPGAALGASSGVAATPKTLTGHVPPQIRGATRLAPAAADENVDLSLVLNLDQALLDQTLAGLYGPNAPANRRFLTSAEFIQKFDLARKRQALKDFAAGAGLTVAVPDEPGSLVVKVSGPVGVVQNAFGVQLNRYRAADGQEFRGHETDPVIPAALAPHLQAVLGLSNYRGARKPHVRLPRRGAGAIGTAGASVSGRASPATLPGNGPDGGLSPADIKSIYGLSGSLTGSGQTVALLEFDGYSTADVAAYENNSQIFPSSPNTPVTFVSIDGVPNKCGSSQNSPCNAATYNAGDNGMLEVALDIDMVIALAPGVSQILVYTAFNSDTSLNAYAKFASDNAAKSISTSWGLPEQSATSASMNSENTVLQQMAAQGQTVFAAAGDNGAYDGGGDTTLMTDDPASQPYVTAVGGTTLSGTISSHSESVWNDGCVDSSGNSVSCSASVSYEAGGGGVANYSGKFWPLPNWQTGVSGTFSQQFRNVPDVTLNADPNAFPYAVSVGGGFTLVGGTSAGAPLWAAAMALVNQQRVAGGLSTMGFANPTFYQLGTGASYANYFNDITSGGNGNSGGLYAAGPGYDNASGWGSFKANALIGALSTPLVPAAPGSPPFSQVSTGSIVFSWGQGTNASGITYVAQASTAANFSGTVLTKTGTALSAGFGGLFSDASYYFQVQGVGGPFLNAGPQATLAAVPALSANTFSSLGAASFTLGWSSGGDQPDTLYQADVSPNVNFPASGMISQQVRTPAATFSGLTANTPYYARVEAIGRAGGASAELALGSTTTLLLPPTLTAQPYSGQTTNGFSFSFNAADPAGTSYLVRVSADAGFAVINASAITTSASVSFSGLLSNQLYRAEVAALNQSGSPSAFAVAPATATAVAAPLPAAVPVTTFTATALGFAWSAGTLAPGTSFLAQVSSSPAFAFGVASSATANGFATFAGLQPNTTYFGRVQATSSNPPTPSGPFLAAAAGATLPNPPLPAAGPFPEVDFTSATVAWSALPLSPQNAAAEGYLVQFSTLADFSTIAASRAAAAGASSAIVTGLAYGTPYFARVGAIGWEGFASELSLGSTTTLVPPLSSGTVAGSGITLSLPPAFSQISAITVYVPPGAFPPGTPISAAANFAALPAPVTNEASSIVPFGANVAVVLSANDLQPTAPVTLTMAYDFTQIPPGRKESTLQLWRYDPAASQWTAVPSHDDPVGHVLTAQTPHFSTFAPFFTAAGVDVSSVQVFPQPWEIGDPASQYWSSVLTLSGLPGGASVKIFTMMGELVWSGTAAASGMLTWDGNNRFGRRVASGTYYASFQNGGQTKIRRLVIIR